MSSGPVDGPADGPLCTLELCKEAFKFSAAHFTIFTATERERLHGHDFFVSCTLTGRVGADGLISDYGRFKRQLRRLCDALDERLLLPDRSPHLVIERPEAPTAGEAPDEPYVVAVFDGRRMPFLADEVLILPVGNITLEALSVYLLDQLLDDEDALVAQGISAVSLKVSAGPGQSASAGRRLGVGPGQPGA